jgi:hypothetical protein
MTSPGVTAPALILASLSATKGAAVTGAVRETGVFKDAGAEFPADNCDLPGCLLAVADVESSVAAELE